MCFTGFTRSFYIIHTNNAVTCEFENVPSIALEMAPKECIKSPGITALKTAQNRLCEKDTAKLLGIPTAPYWKIESIDDLANAMRFLDSNAILKTAKFGYDGKGQIRTKTGDDPEIIWKEINTDIASAQHINESYDHSMAKLKKLEKSNADKRQELKDLALT